MMRACATRGHRLRSGAYSSSKHALRAATDAMRQEYHDKGVSVSLIAPGYVRSQMCDPSKQADCGIEGPETTTTPAYYDALVSPRPRTKYLVANIGLGGLAASLAIPIINTFFPSRAYDALASVAGPKKKEMQQQNCIGPKSITHRVTPLGLPRSAGVSAGFAAAPGV